MSPKCANSLGFVEIPNTGLNKSGYKGLWIGYNVYVPFDNNEMYKFIVDEEVLDRVQTCDVIVMGETARIKKTKNQNYFGSFIDGVMILDEG